MDLAMARVMAATAMAERGMEAAMKRIMAVTATAVMSMAVITVVTLRKKLKMSRIR